MIIIEWEVINIEKSNKQFNSISTARRHFNSLYKKWIEVVPVIKTIITERQIFILFKDGYLSIKEYEYDN